MARASSPDVWSPPLTYSGELSLELWHVPPNEIRIVLLGKTGTGKSRTGCSILGIRRTFPWTLQPTSTTTKCEWRTANRFNKKLDVVDTPGVFDAERSNEEIQDEIRKCISLTTPGPHAILLCVQMGKFTQEDIHTVHHFLKYFGEELIKFIILVFTRADDWERKQKDLGTNINIETYIQGLPKDPRKLLQKCKNRYILWNNRLDGPEMDNQVENLLQKIDLMVRDNNGSYYTNEDYEKAEQLLQSLLRWVPQVGIPVGTPAVSFTSSNSSSFGNDFYTSFESDNGGPQTQRDRAKNSNDFLEKLKSCLRTISEKLRNFWDWLRGTNEGSTQRSGDYMTLQNRY